MEFKPDSPLVAAVVVSPNHGERKGCIRPDSVVLHYTGMTSGKAAIARLCDPAFEVSCHYVVEENGCILQLVPEARRAWHAGRSRWAGETDMNSRSIGIEIVNAGHDGGLPPYPARQIHAVTALLKDILRRTGISPARVLAHSDIAPGRKTDPGERFPWQTLHESGAALWTKPAPISKGAILREGDSGEAVAALQHDLASLGFGLDVTGNYCERTRDCVAAFQSRHRPRRVDGAADGSTLRTLAAFRTLVRDYSAAAAL